MYNNNPCQNFDGKMSKVYINPNFNRQDNLQIRNKMFVNPNFPQVTSNMYFNNFQPSIESANSKIHVNPNFIRNSNVRLPTIASTSISLPSNAPSTSSYFESKQECNQETTAHVQKSRYTLVRHIDNINKPVETITKPAQVTVSKPVRVSKYKSISLNVVKNMIAVKSTVDTAVVKNVILKNVGNSSRFRFIKPISNNAIRPSEKKQAKYSRRHSLNKSIATPRSIRKNNTKMKKNNIPCPLFRKYGSCLRKRKGNCEYLHDRKHVSICRKFIKGVCHNTNCLLSHDLTDKKMPTCYFYLKGACTKENCPYLHVKHNEKTKTCQDFLKGYCEKGDKCHFRHISVAKGSKTNKVSHKKESLYLPRNKHNYNHEVNVKNNQSLEQKNLKRDEDMQQEQRYFKDVLDDRSSSELCNSIKPNRIKLGTLPSFIQL